MAFQLIPFPISIIFILVFGAAIIVILWKLRKKGKVYRMLSNISLIVGLIVLILIIASMTSTLLQETASSFPYPTITPQPLPP